MLQLLGFQVAHDRQLWAHLCRLMRHRIRYHQHRLQAGSEQEAAGARASLEAVRCTELPNPPIAASFRLRQQQRWGGVAFSFRATGLHSWRSQDAGADWC